MCDLGMDSGQYGARAVPQNCLVIHTGWVLSWRQHLRLHYRRDHRQHCLVIHRLTFIQSDFVFIFTLQAIYWITLQVWRSSALHGQCISCTLHFAVCSLQVGTMCNTYGRKSADCTKHENYVIFFVFFATVFGNLEVWKVKKWNIFLKYISAGV